MNRWVWRINHRYDPRKFALSVVYSIRRPHRMKPFNKILVANRGEIALRVMRTCRAMGISTVAIYSDADMRAPHVRCADEAVYVGPSQSSHSYLNVEKIIDAAKRTGADAIHPGYGFLSENADFAETCECAGITFIGPTAEVIRKMGLKSTARAIMAKAGIPIVPGYDEGEQYVGALSTKAQAIGFPVLIKASAGGGGKGMRVVRDATELPESLEAACREAEKAFSDGTLLLEKYVEGARHIEVQILGDQHGHLIHLFERECSIQRRHQKIIEETPSPAVSAELRRRICEAAVAAGRAIGYTNAGTVEFILAPSGEFYFIEMNTRLQVEHRVTEMITGLDLVRLQIEIAEGKALLLAQQDIAEHGHSIEARLYAEDPKNLFLPATGKLREWEAPLSIEGLLTDAGVERGTEVGIHYDPMLAKLIAHASDRESARRKLAYGLAILFAAGVQTNREFLIKAIEHPEFASGNYHTGFVDQHLDELITQTNQSEDLMAASVVALFISKRLQAEATTLPNLPPCYRNNRFRDPSIKLQVGGTSVDISWRSIGNESFAISSGDWQANLQLVSFERDRIRASIDGIQRVFRISEEGDQFFVQANLVSRVVRRLPRYPHPQAASEHESAYAPMPGQVLRVLVDVGQHVLAGDALVILEAMKMEQTLRAATEGRVEAVLVKQGDVVAPGDRLVEIAAAMSEA